MKQLFIILIFSAMAMGAGAKIIVTRPACDEHTAGKTSRHNTFSNIRLDIKGDNIIFKGLPKNNLGYYVVNARGSIEQQGTLSRKNNILDITKLPKGKHTIALKQGNDIKLFGWLEEVVVKGD